MCSGKWRGACTAAASVFTGWLLIFLMHRRRSCLCRPVQCTYVRIGCQWTGPFHRLSAHELSCAHPRKPGAEILDVLRTFDERKEKEVRVYKQMLDLLSCEKLVFTGMYGTFVSFALSLIRTNAVSFCHSGRDLRKWRLHPVLRQPGAEAVIYVFVLFNLGSNVPFINIYNPFLSLEKSYINISRNFCWLLTNYTFWPLCSLN